MLFRRNYAANSEPKLLRKLSLKKWAWQVLQVHKNEG